MNRRLLLAVLISLGLGASVHARDVEVTEPVVAVRQELDAEKKAALAALRQAKRAGDKEMADRIGRQLGWASSAPETEEMAPRPQPRA